MTKAINRTLFGLTEKIDSLLLGRLATRYSADRPAVSTKSHMIWRRLQ